MSHAAACMLKELQAVVSLSRLLYMQANAQQGACQRLLAMEASWPSTLRTVCAC